MSVRDPRKARINYLKHGIHFSDAEAALFDPMALTQEDVTSASERRFVTIGIDHLGRTVVVVYSQRDEDLRLISARHATRRERRQYEEGIRL
ncbi:MAG TPA: BrnT family toxin [Candidatus Polarisedimenticolia bacterium]|nr:BrnT family toxin [Candidatus Polarisedimenticolia bacterium]